MSSRKYGNLMGIDRTVGIKGVTGQPMASVQVPVGEGCCMVGLCEPPDAHNIPMSVWIAFSPLLRDCFLGVVPLHHSHSKPCQNYVLVPAAQSWHNRADTEACNQHWHRFSYEERSDMLSKYPIHIH